jgi:hypothetical protein
MKTCSICKLIQPITNFYRQRKRKASHVSECITCFKKRMAHRHQEHKDTLVAEFGGKCVRCGYDKSSRVLVFHHLNIEPKSFGISQSLSKGLATLRKECAKCILLCPNCHAEFHLGLWETK